MLTLNFDPFPILHTERLVLRRMGHEDAEEIFFLRSDTKMLQYLDRDPAQSINEAIQWIDTINRGIVNNEYIAWAICLKNDNRLIGTTSLWNVKKEHFRSEVGYALHPDFQGKGIMNEAMIEVLDYGFRVMQLHSVEANVNPGNKSSIKLLERNNFIQEAYFRENYYYNGRFLDSVIYSLLNPYC